MADLRYNVAVDTKGAQQSLKGLQSAILSVAATVGGALTFRAVTDISARFQDLRTTLGILFKDVEVGAQAFEQIKTFATQSIFTVEDLTASVIKLKAAGLEPTIKQLQLFADVSSVSADAVGALQAITDLYARTSAGGLGLEELNRLGDRGIPVFTILSEKLGINRLEISKLGQTAEGAAIILGALEEGMEEAFGGASAARANNLSQSFSNLEDALGNAADIIGQGGLNDALADAIRSLSGFIDANAGLFKWMGETIGTAIGFIADNLKYITALLAGFFAAFAVGKILAVVGALNAMRKSLSGVATAGAILQGVTGVGLIKLAAGVAAAAGVVASIEKMTSGTAKSVEELKDELDALSTAGDNIGPLTADPTAPAAPKFRELLADLKNDQAEITRSTINYFDQYKMGVNDLMAAVKQEGELLKLTESQANIQQDLNRFATRYYQAIRPLQQDLTELKLKDTEESKVQVAEIEKQLAAMEDLYNTSRKGLEDMLRLREANREEQEKELALLDVLNNRRDFFADMDKSVRDAQSELRKLSLNKFEIEIADINSQIDNDLVEAIRKVKEKWEDGLITSDAYMAEINTLEEHATKTFEKLTELAKQQRDAQRTFGFGWKRAFEDFEDNATNAAKSAEKIFKTTTKGIEDTIVNFAKTGKFEFKSLINDILEQLLRSQIQQVIAQTFGAFGGGSSTGGGLSSLFAGFFANGGMIPAGSFGVVGERGPELVSGPATVTPMGGGGAVTYNINAVDASSFKQMVARDPGFIHAVASQGARKVPVRR